MGSSSGYYSYDFKFSSPDLIEMKSRTKSTRLTRGTKPVVVEIRSRFLIKGRKRTGEVFNVVLESERFDIIGVSLESDWRLSFFLHGRLMEYWMTSHETDSLSAQLMSFAGELTAANPSLKRIPVAVDLDVCTIQQPGESYRAAEARAIVPSKLYPLHLFTAQSVVEKPMDFKLLEFLHHLHMVRVEDPDQGLALMSACPLCFHGPHVAEQITQLKCNCAFHTHCIVRYLERNNLCPTCRALQFDSSFLFYANAPLIYGDNYDPDSDYDYEYDSDSDYDPVPAMPR